MAIFLKLWSANLVQMTPFFFFCKRRMRRNWLLGDEWSCLFSLCMGYPTLEGVRPLGRGLKKEAFGTLFGRFFWWQEMWVGEKRGRCSLLQWFGPFFSFLGRKRPLPTQPFFHAAVVNGKKTFFFLSTMLFFSRVVYNVGNHVFAPLWGPFTPFTDSECLKNAGNLYSEYRESCHNCSFCFLEI